jgi:uncharacterized protein (TIGR00251 family)
VVAARLSVHVTPKSGRDEVQGWSEQGELRVRVKAPADKGMANAAACALLALKLGVPKTDVRVVAGRRSRHKTIEAKGVDRAALLGAFGPVDEDS